MNFNEHSSYISLISVFQQKAWISHLKILMNFLYSQQNRELPLVIFQQKLRWALIVEVQQHMLF